MIVGIGIDCVEIERIAALLAGHEGRARDRLFTPLEVELARASGRELEVLAGRFAAKEAAMKALGTGWTGGIGFRDFEIGRQASGAPVLTLHGKAAAHAESLGVRRSHVSLTHTRTIASAVVVMESS